MPSEWLKEMQQGRETEVRCARVPEESCVLGHIPSLSVCPVPHACPTSEQGPGHVPAAAAEQRSSRRDRQPTRLPADDSAQDGEEDGGGLKVFQPSLTSFVVSSLASLVVVGAAIYYANRMHRPAKSARGIQSGLLIASELDRVYNYLSTPDFRTEWHFNAVEVSGPAIDHSAVPGEMFAEELRVGGRDVNLDWNVLERQFPTSPQTTFAEFVVEGTAAVDSPSGPARKEHWRQVFRMRAGPQQFGGGDQVHVEFELIVDGKDAKDTPDKWRKSLLRSIKRLVPPAPCPKRTQRAHAQECAGNTDLPHQPPTGHWRMPRTGLRKTRGCIRRRTRSRQKTSAGGKKSRRARPRRHLPPPQGRVQQTRRRRRRRRHKRIARNRRARKASGEIVAELSTERSRIAQWIRSFDDTPEA